MEGNEQAGEPTTGYDQAINEYRKHLWDALRAGQEQYDKYLLTLSSGGLAISLVLIKDVFGKIGLVWPAVLITSWVLFCLCIVSTVASFIASQHCLDRHLKRYESCVRSGNYDKMNTPDRLQTLTKFLNWASGIFFFLAIAATITFASRNLTGGALMIKEPATSREGLSTQAKGKSGDSGRGYVPPSPPKTPNPGMGYTPPAPPTQQTPTPGSKPGKK